MRFNYGYQDLPNDIIAKTSNYVLEKVTNLKEGSCIMTSIASNEVISSYVSHEDGLKAMAYREYKDKLNYIQEYININETIRRY